MDKLQSSIFSSRNGNGAVHSYMNSVGDDATFIEKVQYIQWTYGKNIRKRGRICWLSLCESSAETLDPML